MFGRSSTKGAATGILQVRKSESHPRNGRKSFPSRFEYQDPKTFSNPEVSVLPVVYLTSWHVYYKCLPYHIQDRFAVLCCLPTFCTYLQNVVIHKYIANIVCTYTLYYTVHCVVVVVVLYVYLSYIVYVHVLYTTCMVHLCVVHL